MTATDEPPAVARALRDAAEARMASWLKGDDDSEPPFDAARWPGREIGDDEDPLE